MTYDLTNEIDNRNKIIYNKNDYLSNKNDSFENNDNLLHDSI